MYGFCFVRQNLSRVLYQNLSNIFCFISPFCYHNWVNIDKVMLWFTPWPALEGSYSPLEPLLMCPLLLADTGDALGASSSHMGHQHRVRAGGDIKLVDILTELSTLIWGFTVDQVNV